MRKRDLSVRNLIPRVTDRARRTLRWTRSQLTLPHLLILAAVVVYSAYWSSVSILKLESLNASIFDLGVSAQIMWDFLHLQWLPSIVVFNIFFRGFVFVIFPLELTGSYPVLLVTQSIFLGLGAFPVYGAAKKLLGKEWLGTLLGLAYLLYFPLAGLNWYDFHFEAFFPFLFLTGYYFYVTQRFRWALVFFVLSGTTAFLYMLFPLIFSVMTGLEVLYETPQWKQLLHGPQMRFAWVLGAISLFFLVVSFAIGSWHVDQATGGYLHSSTGGPLSNLDVKIMTVLVLLAPLLFLPVYSARGVALLSPFAYILFTVNYAPYEFPGLLHYQYGSLIVPPMMIGLIEGLRWVIRRDDHRTDVPRLAHRWRLSRRLLHRENALPVAILTSVALFALVFQPYGPYNEYSGSNFDVANATVVNQTLLENLQQILSMVPSNSSAVMLQDNLPQALPGVWGERVIIPGFVGPNITAQDIANDSYPYTGTGRVVDTRIDYVVADLTHTDTFLYPLVGGFPGMYTMLSQFLSSGYYGVKAEAGGLVLVVRAYKGPLALYRPYDGTYTTSQMTIQPVMQEAGSIACISNYTSPVNNSWGGMLLWNGPFLSLAPGYYNATFRVFFYGNAPTNQLTVDVAGNLGQDIVESTTYWGGQVASGIWQDVRIGFNLTNFLSIVEFRGFTEQWQGEVCLSEVTLIQSAGGVPGQVLRTSNDRILRHAVSPGTPGGPSMESGVPNSSFPKEDRPLHAGPVTPASQAGYPTSISVG